MSEPVIVSPKEGELLPCPFCGSEAGLEHDAEGTVASWYVYCRDTREGCPIGMANSVGTSRRVEAVTAWNKRMARLSPLTAEEQEHLDDLQRRGAVEVDRKQIIGGPK